MNDRAQMHTQQPLWVHTIVIIGCLAVITFDTIQSALGTPAIVAGALTVGVVSGGVTTLKMLYEHTTGGDS